MLLWKGVGNSRMIRMHALTEEYKFVKFDPVKPTIWEDGLAPSLLVRAWRQHGVEVRIGASC